MPNNKNSQRGFVETIALLGITLLLLTLPLAQKLATEKQSKDIRNYAACEACTKWSEEQKACVWDFSGGGNSYYISCCCSNQGACRENSEWITKYCGGGSQQPVQPPQQTTNQICKTIGEKCIDPDYPELCTIPSTGQQGTRRCHKEGTCFGVGGGDQCYFAEGSYCGNCVSSSAILPSPTQAPVQPPPAQPPAVAITPEYSQGPCGGNDERCAYGTTCMCKLVNGSWTPAETLKQTGFAACCSQAAPAQPAAVVSCNKQITGPYLYPLSDGTKVYCDSTTKITEQQYNDRINNISAAGKPAAPVQPAADTYLYTCENDNGTYYTKIIKNGTLIKSTPCEFGCKNDRECNPAPAVPAPAVPAAGFTGWKCSNPYLIQYINGVAQREPQRCPDGCTDGNSECNPAPAAPAVPAPNSGTFKPILCSMTKCNQSNKTYFINCTATGDCTTYKNYPCVNATLLSDLSSYCSESQSQEPVIQNPAVNPCAVADDGATVQYKDGCWICVGGQPTTLTNSEQCGIKTPQQPAIQTNKPPELKPQKPKSKTEQIINSALRGTPILGPLLMLLGFLK